MFRTYRNEGIGFLGEPLRLYVENLEAVSGSSGVFFDMGNVNIGGVSEDVDGISTFGGNIEIKSTGNVTLNETISTIAVPWRLRQIKIVNKTFKTLTYSLFLVSCSLKNSRIFATNAHRIVIL
ncbi:MAG: hypothetical protein MGU50_22080 [Trichodesmium sp. MAG_R02]|nr:hypothetical protein [Trichodesmium sp. MAG_R02]